MASTFSLLLLALTFSVGVSQPDEAAPPNILVFIVDDLGWNQVGYHANKAGNHEVKTPNIDLHAENGIELDRGYMTPWCGPSRAAIQTGRTNIFNANVSNDVIAFDDDIGFVGGMPPGTETIATAFKKYGEKLGKPYKAYYNGKWGIGGTAWSNTPMGMGYDETRGFWGDSIENCDGWITLLTSPPYVPIPFTDEFGGVLGHVMPGYFDQNSLLQDTEWCPLISSIDNTTLSDEEKFIACKTHPRKPPKIIDEDLLDNVKRQINNHNYDEGPMLQVFATQTTHTPMQYPNRFNEDDETLPSYFQSDKTKPTASAYDQRMGTNNVLKFVDYLFGETMQALKDSGQWNNTIVYFTSDNGGAIYTGTVNNNYPLRASKFTAFEGGIRVPQFISGGWIDNKIASSSKRKSETFVFPIDIAPTLLEMAGADSSFLLGDKKGAVYGNSVWSQIKDSASDHSSSSWQLERNVSYSSDLYFEVKAEKTVKNMYVGSQPILMPRHWDPIWPRNDDLLMDFGYVSVMPCRPGGVASSCCKLDITGDPREFYPLNATCQTMKRDAARLFEIEGGCYLDSAGNYANNMCLQPGNRTVRAHVADEYSLWSVVGAHSPFTNSTGYPIRSNTTECYCDTIENGTSPSEIDYFTPTLFYPSSCYSSEANPPPRQAIPCNSSKLTGQSTASFDDYSKKGFNRTLLETINSREREQLTFLAREELIQNIHAYASRKGYTEWPNVAKMPYNADALDSCPEKNVTLVPMPFVSLVPYMYGAQNPTVPFNASSGFTIMNTTLQLGLCQSYNNFLAFCPAKVNPNMTAVISWNIDPNDPTNTFGLLADGRKLEPMSLLECAYLCQTTPDGTAYIGGPETLPYGLEFSVNEGRIPNEISNIVSGVEIMDVLKSMFNFTDEQARSVLEQLTPAAIRKIMKQFSRNN